MGYFSFIVLSITHFHNDGLNSLAKTAVFSLKTTYAADSDSPENCQICHAFSSININSVIILFSSGLLIENCTLIKNDFDFRSTHVEVNYLRGPPSYNIRSI
ncbi:MAG: hypothetical protein P4L35_05295 [Ignavibacteriaceae bacterium]|nr:hypothetical protein [Ignavibacteriaceae bacterium]